jgi:thymidylate synthase (FAD)
MKRVTPQVALLARPAIDWDTLWDYAEGIGASEWVRTRNGLTHDGELLTEVGGKMCYRSWEPGLNPNVTRVREDRVAYLENILASGHGSVLEHANYTFILRDISRIVSHELVRHRAGTAVSQESMRYVRLDEVPFWFPEWAKQDQVLLDACVSELIRQEHFQTWLARYFKLDEPGTPFHEKKHKTSFMRRFAPSGVATSMVWTANIRALRHVIALRTDPAAEEEIRIVAGKLGRLMRREVPALFGDFEVTDGAWVPKNAKV